MLGQAHDDVVLGGQQNLKAPEGAYAQSLGGDSTGAVAFRALPPWHAIPRTKRHGMASHAAMAWHPTHQAPWHGIPRRHGMASHAAMACHPTSPWHGIPRRHGIPSHAPRPGSPWRTGTQWWGARRRAEFYGIRAADKVALEATHRGQAAHGEQAHDGVVRGRQEQRGQVVVLLLATQKAHAILARAPHLLILPPALAQRADKEATKELIQGASIHCKPSPCPVHAQSPLTCLTCGRMMASSHAKAKVPGCGLTNEPGKQVGHALCLSFVSAQVGLPCANLGQALARMAPTSECLALTQVGLADATLGQQQPFSCPGSVRP